MKNQDEILTHYLHAILWTEELDGGHDIEEIKGVQLERCKKDIADFVDKAGNLLDGISEEQIGHDLWLTRNGHGAGFWDRGYGVTGEKLTTLAQEMKGVDVFKCENNTIELMFPTIED